SCCTIHRFFFIRPPTCGMSTLSLHDALPILTAGAAVVALSFLIGCTTPESKPEGVGRGISFSVTPLYPHSFEITAAGSRLRVKRDRKSTRLNSSHSQISYAVFCLKKKKEIIE